MNASKRFRWSAVLVAIVLAGLHVFVGVPADAQDNTCEIAAPDLNDVWVIIYDADADGNRKEVLWEGRIKAGQSFPVTSSDGHIRYEFTLDPNQPYQGDIAAGCYQHNTILVD